MTSFGNEAGGLYSAGTRVAKLFAKSPAHGAETLVYLGSSPQVAAVTGEFFYECRRGKSTAEAQDDALAQMLWTASEKLPD